MNDTNYYPFGLTMSGISTKAPGKLENRYKYNEIEFAGKEFNNGSGLEMYEAEYRNLDPQIGRWWQVDPRPTDHISPYASMDLNPIKNSDFYGDTSVPYHDLPNTPNFDPSKDVVILPEVEVKPTPAPTPLKKPEIDMNAKAGAAIGIPLPVSAPWTVPSVEIRPISIAAPNPIVLTIGLVLLPANYGGDGGSSYIKPGSHRYGGYHVPPKVLPGFPGAVREKPKAGRARWRLPNGKILEWDYQHGRVEQYDRTGRRHEGEYDPNTGEQTKPPDSGRSTQN